MFELIAEKYNPQADVYWADEPIRAEVLRQQHISAPYLSPNADGIPATFRDPRGYWTGFAARARVLIVHKDENPKPTSVFSYSDPRWRGRTVIANLLFGTTRSLFFWAMNARAHSCTACTRMTSNYPLAMATAPIWWRAGSLPSAPSTS